MNGYNFTERVRKCLQLARMESVELHHEYVGTEHLLLGICREGGGVANAAMQNLNVEAARIRESVLEVLKPGQPEARTGVDLPYTSRAKKVLELAMSEARENHHSYVGTEHLLLGLILEERGIAAQILVSLGLTTERVRAEVLRLLGGEMKTDATAPAPRGRPAELQAAITLIVEHPDGRIETKKFRRAGDAVSFLNELEY
jgi:ATP-dependent Clp protease ATP-binding subunit ClpC